MKSDRYIHPSDLKDTIMKNALPRPQNFPDLNALAHNIEYAKGMKDDPAYIKHLENLLQRGNAFGGHGTHIPALAAVAAISSADGDIIELGAGMFSTLVFDEIARAKGVRVWTLESHADWIACFDDIKSDMHQFIHVPTWDGWQPAIDAATSEMQNRKGERQARWGLAFVDHAAGTGRADAVVYFKDKADYVVAHDTGNEFFTNLDPALATFRFINDYLPICPPTTIVSDYFEIAVGTPRNR